VDLATLPLDITEWLHPEAWLKLFGTFATIGVLLIIFAETGLLFGCILPGDSLLFTAGILTAVDSINGEEFQRLPLPWLLVGGPVAAIAGAQLGHLLGARYGRKLFDRPDSRIFKQEWVEKAEYYFNRFGPAKAVVLARFIPIVRTFLNPLAGMLGMDRRRFFLWNCVGAILWTDTLFLLGHFLGSEVPNIERYILPGVGVILVLSVIPIVREVLKGRKADRGPNKNGPEESRPSLSGDSYR
jgi:membrane-associated protein